MSEYDPTQPRPRFAPSYCCGPYPKPQPQPPRPPKPPKPWCPCQQPNPKPCCNPCCRRRCDPCGFDDCCDDGIMRKTLIPAVLGDDSKGSPYEPQNGAYRNMLVEYQANGAVYVYTGDGIPTRIKDGSPKTN